jgi:hypothetical protein
MAAGNNRLHKSLHQGLTKEREKCWKEEGSRAIKAKRLHLSDPWQKSLIKKDSLSKIQIFMSHNADITEISHVFPGWTNRSLASNIISFSNTSNMPEQKMHRIRPASAQGVTQSS